MEKSFDHGYYFQESTHGGQAAGKFIKLGPAGRIGCGGQASSLQGEN